MNFPTYARSKSDILFNRNAVCSISSLFAGCPSVMAATSSGQNEVWIGSFKKTSGILPMARIANIFHALILPVVAEVLIHLLDSAVGYHVSGQKVIPELFERQGHPGSILGTKGYITVPDFDSECCQFITSLHVGSPLSGAGVAGYFWRFRFFFGELLKLFRPFQMKGT